MFLITCFASNLIAANDILFWNSNAFSKSIHSNYAVQIKIDQRFNHHLSTLYFHFYDFEITHDLNHNFRISAAYRQIYQKKNNFLVEHRPHLNFISKIEYQTFSFKNRIRYEFRNKNNTKTEYRIRDRLKIDKKFFLKKLPMRIYCCNEIFFETTHMKRNQNWFFIGLILPEGNQIYFEFMAGIQSKNDKNQWVNDKILGSNIHYKL